jgi:gliding motility associated protien GldN
MYNKFFKLILLVIVFTVGAQTLHAQAKRVVKKRAHTAKKTTTNKNTGNANAKLVAPAKDTIPVAIAPQTLTLDTVRKSLRQDNIVDKNPVKDITPLNYEYIREDDAVYQQRIWREIDVHEKMNLAFLYRADEDNGNQRFISILLNHIKTGEVTAFSPIDDRFTTPITVSEITKQLVGEAKIVPVPDWAKDPDGSKGIMKDSLLTEEFNPDNTIEKYWIKEDWVFDKESSRMHSRILGIAPLKTIRNPDGSYRDVTPLFWVYYPDLRPILVKYQAYNGKNYGARSSWEEIFESRMFSSRIIKSTYDNPYDQYIANYIKDPILRLLEGDNIKDKIFNYEQDLWSY